MRRYEEQGPTWSITGIPAVGHGFGLGVGTNAEAKAEAVYLWAKHIR